MIMLMQMNPDVLAQLGVGHRGISQELDRIEKTKELQVPTWREGGGGGGGGEGEEFLKSEPFLCLCNNTTDLVLAG